MFLILSIPTVRTLDSGSDRNLCLSSFLTTRFRSFWCVFLPLTDRNLPFPFFSEMGWRQISVFLMALLLCDVLIYYYGYGRFVVSTTVQVASPNIKSRSCPYSSASPCFSVSYEGYVVESDVQVSVLIERHLLGIIYSPPNWPAANLEKCIARDYPIGSRHVAYFTNRDPYDNGRSSISSPVNGIVIFDLVILTILAVVDLSETQRARAN
jgi:hypothetical protein